MTEMVITSIAIFFAIIGMIIGLAYVPGARGLAIPCFFLLLGLSLAHTVWIWNATMLLVILVRYIILIMRRENHPEGKKTVVDYNTVLMFQPFLFLGVHVGFLFVQTIPIGIKVVLAGCVCAFLAGITFYKAGLEREKERIKREEMKSISNGESIALENNYGGMSSNPDLSPELARYYEEAKRIDEDYFPYWKMFLLLLQLICLVAVNLFIGSGATRSLVGVVSCSPLYWVGHAAFAIIEIVFIYYSYCLVKREWDLKQAIGWKLLPSEFEWSLSLICKMALFVCFAGYFSSNFGLGGVAIMTVVLDSQKVHTDVTYYTTNVNLMLICLTTTIMFFVNGQFPITYFSVILLTSAVPVALFSFFFIATFLRSHYSTLLYVFSGVLAVSTLLVFSIGIIKMYVWESHATLWGFGSVCPSFR